MNASGIASRISPPPRASSYATGWRRSAIPRKDGKVAGIEDGIYRVARRQAGLAPGDTGVIAADQIVQGDRPDIRSLRPRTALRMESGRIAIDGEGRTSLNGVWAGGDCVLGGDDLTVSAVAQGRDAAKIHQPYVRCRRAADRCCRLKGRIDMADLRNNFVGIKSSEPVHPAPLRGAADRQGLQRRARLQGKLGRCRVEDAGRGRPACRQRQRPALWRDLGRRDRRTARPQQYRADHRPRPLSDQFARNEAGEDETGRIAPSSPRSWFPARSNPGRRSCRWWRKPAQMASSSISAVRTACPSAAWAPRSARCRNTSRWSCAGASNIPTHARHHQADAQHHRHPQDRPAQPRPAAPRLPCR